VTECIRPTATVARALRVLNQCIELRRVNAILKLQWQNCGAHLSNSPRVTLVMHKFASVGLFDANSYRCSK